MKKALEWSAIVLLLACFSMPAMSEEQKTEKSEENQEAKVAKLLPEIPPGPDWGIDEGDSEDGYI